MRQPQQWNGIWTIALIGCLTHAVWLLVTQPVRADTNLEATESNALSVIPANQIPQLSDVEQPALKVEEWESQLAQTTAVQITGVQLNPTDSGIEIIVDSKGELEQASTSVVGNALVVDIPNVVLNLPDGEEFQAANPSEDIALVSITALPGNRVRIVITGLNAPPVAEIRQVELGLIVSLSPGTEVSEEDNDTIQVVVTGEQESGYAADNATTATRTDTPLRDIPQSIQVIPRQVLEDQQVLQLQEALRNVPGVTEGGSFGNATERYIIRGFETRTYLRDDFREDEQYVRDLANVERIEVLRGPASVLYGSLEPGGVVSITTEQPLDFPFYSVELQGGSFGLIRPSIDISGPLDSEGIARYRINAAYQRSDGFRDFDQEFEQIFVAPVLTVQIGDRTDLNLEVEYLNSERPFDRGLIAFEDEVIDIPFDRIRNEPDDVVTSERLSGGYRLKHQFSDDWTLRNAFRFSSSDSLNRRAERRGLDEATGDITGDWLEQEDNFDIYALQIGILGEFATGPIAHNLLFGLALSRRTNVFEDYSGIAAPTLNIFDPVYGTASRPDREDFPDIFINETETDSLGIYLQDQVTLLDNLKVLVGGRFDLVDQQSSFSGTSGEGDSWQQDEAFSPRIGLVYQPIAPLSLYASYSRSFVPNSGTTVEGDILEPTRGTQYEVGIRGEFLNRRLLANLAAYHLTKSNIAATDPDNPDFSIAVGEQRSQGIEFDVSGEILPGWNIIASYAYTDAEVTEDTTSEIVGNRLFNVPEYSASLWTTYEIQAGDFQGLGFGLGLFFVGERQGDLDNTFEVPGYVRTDASVFYRRDNWRVGVNVKNLFDIDYVESATFRAGINPGIPLTVLVTVSVEF